MHFCSTILSSLYTFIKRSLRSLSKVLESYRSFYFKTDQSRSLFARRLYLENLGKECYSGDNHLISNKREWNNCFIKNAHKISLNLPDSNKPEKTWDFRYSHVTRLSKLSTRERTRLDCMNEKSKHCSDEH